MTIPSLYNKDMYSKLYHLYRRLLLLTEDFFVGPARPPSKLIFGTLDLLPT